MYDLFVAGDLVRKQTEKAVATEGSARRSPKNERLHRHAVRSGSAAALRGLAELLEPSRRETALG